MTPRLFSTALIAITLQKQASALQMKLTEKTELIRVIGIVPGVR